jgi:type VI secretion system secreted protein Hcp
MAAVDYWLTIDGVQGESKDSTLSGAIQLESWNWGEKNKGTWNVNGGGGSGKVEMSDFSFTMWFNQASPKLFVMCATGQHIDTAQLICRKAGGGQQQFLTVNFSNLVISSFDTVGGGDGNVVPLNNISFNFEQIQINYQPQQADGTVGATTTAGYDLKKNAQM